MDEVERDKEHADRWLRAVNGESRTLSRFLDWILDKKGLQLFGPGGGA